MKNEKYREALFIVTYRRAKNIFGKEKIKYLVLRRHLHWVGWEFPKGGVEGNEIDLEVVGRELLEETGQSGFNIQKYRHSGRYKYKEKLEDRKEYVGQTYTLFSAEIKNHKIEIDKKEHSSYKWVSFKKAEKLLTWKNQKKGLEIVNKNLVGR